jgi:hypothetical protein
LIVQEMLNAAQAMGGRALRRWAAILPVFFAISASWR